MTKVNKGRPWTVEELRNKSWEDLHSLWYICCKERNRIATESHERVRLKMKRGGKYAKDRMMDVCHVSDGLLSTKVWLRLRDSSPDFFSQIRRTQRSIKAALTERWYAWEDAWKIAEEDPDVDLNAEPDTDAFTPGVHEVCQ